GMLGLIALTSQYYLYMTVIISAFIALVYLLFIERRAWRDRRFWLQWVLAGVVALPLVLAAVTPYIALNRQGGLPDRDLGSLRQFAASANPTDYLLPATDHFLFGRWVGETFSRDFWIEQSLTIGWVVMILGVLAWFARDDRRRRHLLILMLAGGLLALVLSFGLDLHWNEQRILISVPPFLQDLVGAAEAPIPLPGILMFKFVPFYAKLRAFSRFGIFVLLFSCAAAGMGASWLLARIKPRWRPLAATGLLLLVLFEFYPGLYRQFSPVQARPVDTWLAQQPGEGAVIQFPFRMGEDQEQIYNTLINGKPYVGGFFNAFPPPQYRSLLPIMDYFPDERSCAMLDGLGVEYVLVHAPAYDDPSWVRTESERCGLVYIDQIGDEMIFMLEP
ncbi:MAG: hypothetical protein HPY76_12560, partial [Anaerolineae bacterium]|nr:hypothetical protein [Anaerolineae bacterium]